jgi:hypothetical protein
MRGGGGGGGALIFLNPREKRDWVDEPAFF